MAINKKVFLGLLIILLALMAGIIIKTFTGSSGSTESSNLTAGGNSAESHPSLSEQARNSRVQKLESMREEAMKAPLLVDPAQQATPADGAAGPASPQTNQTETQPSIVLVPEPGQGDNDTGLLSQSNITEPGQTSNRTPLLVTDSSVRAQTSKAQLPPEKTPPPAKTAPGKGTFKVQVKPSGKAVTMEISASGPINTYKSHVLQSPQRVMLDIDGQWTMSGNPSVPGQNVIDKVRFGRHPNAGRVVADIKAPGQVTVSVAQPSPDKLILTITPK